MVTEASTNLPNAPVQRGREFLVTPGPTPVPAPVLAAMGQQSVDFSGQDFMDLADSVFTDLEPVFRTEGEVFIYAANGHGAWEAALANCLSPGDKVLIPEVGQFSESWRDMAAALGIGSETIPADWRHAIDPNRVEEALRADSTHSIKAVLIVHVDTAASIVSDIAAIRKAIDAAGHPALLMVDTIASLGTCEYRMDDWGVDVTIAGSQKGLMMAPGLSFTAANEKALTVARSSKMPRRYWDWEERTRGEHYQRFCGTAPEQMIFGMRVALDLIAAEGLDAAAARHHRLANAVRAAIEVWSEGGFVSFNALIPGQRSNSVTTILVPEDFHSKQIRDRARNHFGVALGAGIGALRGKAFRIGHMGDINAPHILGALGATEAALRSLDIPIGAGALDAAIAAIADAV